MITPDSSLEALRMIWKAFLRLFCSGYFPIAMPHLIPTPIPALASPPHTRDQRQPAFQTPQNGDGAPAPPSTPLGRGWDHLAPLQPATWILSTRWLQLQEGGSPFWTARKHGASPSTVVCEGREELWAGPSRSPEAEETEGKLLSPRSHFPLTKKLWKTRRLGFPAALPPNLQAAAA